MKSKPAILIKQNPLQRDDIGGAIRKKWPGVHSGILHKMLLRNGSEARGWCHCQALPGITSIWGIDPQVFRSTYGGFHNWGYLKNRMVYKVYTGKALLKWMIWVYLHFRKPSLLDPQGTPRMWNSSRQASCWPRVDLFQPTGYGSP